MVSKRNRGPPGANGKQPKGQVSVNFIDPQLASAIEWARSSHINSCQCRKCTKYRAVIRAAVALTDCDCGWCPLCWAATRVRTGRL